MMNNPEIRTTASLVCCCVLVILLVYVAWEIMKGEGGSATNENVEVGNEKDGRPRRTSHKFPQSANFHRSPRLV